MAKKKIEVVAVNGSVKYEKKFRVPGTDSARFKCDEDIAKELKAAGTVVDAAVFDAQQEPSEKEEVNTELTEVTLDLLEEEYPELLKQIAAKVAEGLYTPAQYDAAKADVPDGYISQAEADKQIKKLQDEVAKLKAAAKK